MSRIDVPTLRCDRCKGTTQDTGEMVKFLKLSHHHISGLEEWDLCPLCRKAFREFLESK